MEIFCITVTLLQPLLPRLFSLRNSFQVHSVNRLPFQRLPSWKLSPSFPFPSNLSTSSISLRQVLVPSSILPSSILTYFLILALTALSFEAILKLVVPSTCTPVHTFSTMLLNCSTLIHLLSSLNGTGPYLMSSGIKQMGKWSEMGRCSTFLLNPASCIRKSLEIKRRRSSTNKGGFLNSSTYIPSINGKSTKLSLSTTSLNSSTFPFELPLRDLFPLLRIILKSPPTTIFLSI